MLVDKFAVSSCLILVLCVGLSHCQYAEDQDYNDNMAQETTNVPQSIRREIGERLRESRQLNQPTIDETIKSSSRQFRNRLRQQVRAALLRDSEKNTVDSNPDFTAPKHYRSLFRPRNPQQDTEALQRFGYSDYSDMQWRRANFRSSPLDDDFQEDESD